MKTKILFVDGEEALQRLINTTFKDDLLHIKTASNAKKALKILRSFSADVVISDIRMPQMDGFELLKKIRATFPDTFVVLMTEHGTVGDAVNAIKAGAYDYILKPFDFEAIRALIKTIRSHKVIHENGTSTGKELKKNHPPENFIGRDPKMLKVSQRIIDVADSNATVLITGETGAGKKSAANAIYRSSTRNSQPFIEVNCSGLTESLLASELFGHEKDSFTGAGIQKKGHLELAHGGTIFLDEIGDISAQTQIALLHVLEEGTFFRIGGTQLLKMDIRFICATNKILSDEVINGSFREDFFYRINVVTLALPPLRERKSDIPLLADYFLKKYSYQAGKSIPRLLNQTKQLLIQHNWPGNVRELRNTMECAVIFCKRKEITPNALAEIMGNINQEKPPTLTHFPRSLADAESFLISRTLRDTDWNMKQAARRLQIARGTLYSKIKKHNISKLQ